MKEKMERTQRKAQRKGKGSHREGKTFMERRQKERNVLAVVQRQDTQFKLGSSLSGLEKMVQAAVDGGPRKIDRNDE